MNTQLTKTNTVLAQAEKDISTLKDTLATANVPLKREIDTLQSEISALMIEIRAQEQEISNEATNQKIWNDSAEIGATQEMRYAPGIAINNGVEYIKQNPWTVVKMG